MTRSKQEWPRFEPEKAFYEHVARGYDITAPSYDEVEGRNEISERVRRMSLAAAIAAFRPDDRILELGCGTGRDAVFLARHGISVVATDVSPAMVAITRARAKRDGVGDRVSARVASATEAAREGGPYDGAYSNGAVLNLEPDLIGLGRRLASSLRPGAKSVLTVANRISLFELLVYPVVARPRKAFRKLGQNVPIPVSREGAGKRYVVPTRFLSPREFLSAFGSDFDVESWRGLQVLTPPWNLVDMARLFRSVVTPLEALEDRFGPIRGFRSLGAIYLMTLRRRG